MPFYGLRAELLTNTKALNQFLKDNESITQDEIFKAMGKVQAKIRRVYKSNTEGRLRISKFLATSRDRKQKPSKGVTLNISVDARNAKGRVKLDRNPVGRSKVNAWNSVIVQEEFGDTRTARFSIEELRGSGTNSGFIESKNGMMAIATEPSRLGLSPRAFNGRWIPTDDPNTALFIANKPGSRTIRAKEKSSRMTPKRTRPLAGNRRGARRAERAQRVNRFRKARKASDVSAGATLNANDVLFVGKKIVPVRDPKPFIAPTIKQMRKEFPKIMFNELGKALPLTARKQK